MVTLIRSDLDFILDQIIIAEQLTAGVPVANLIPHYTLPFGLRQVDGRNNDLLPGNEDFGAADELFPRIVPANYLNDADGDVMVLPGPDVTNNNYGAPGDVADMDPRLISNLIVDQTVGNPAAVLQALIVAGVANPEVAAAAIKAALLAIEAPSVAAAAAHKTEVAYEKALTGADDVTLRTAAATTALNDLVTGLGASYTAADVADAAAAKAAVDGAWAAQKFVVNALAADPTATATELAAATTLRDNLNSLRLAVNAVAVFVIDGNAVLVGTEDVAIGDALNNAGFGADVLDGVAATNQSNLVSAEANAQLASVTADATRDALINGTPDLIVNGLREIVASYGVEMAQDFTLSIPRALST